MIFRSKEIPVPEYVGYIGGDSLPDTQTSAKAGNFSLSISKKMSETKFTPGPWKNYAPVIAGKKDENYRNIEAGQGYFDSKDDNKGKGFSIQGYITKENADLMTAAPALYDVLDDIVNAPSASDIFSLIPTAKRALAKARGETK